MDSATKTKIISFSIFGILILGVIWLFINAGNKQGQKDEDISLRAIDSASVSISDIMAQGNQQGYVTPETYYPRVETSSPTTNLEIEEHISEEKSSIQNQQELEELQNQLRKNMRKNSSQKPEIINYQHPVDPEDKVYKPQEVQLPKTSTKEDTKDSYNQETTEHKEQDQIENTEHKNRFHNGSRTVNKSTQVSVLGDQEVSHGGNLKMILLQNISIDGVTIPKGSSIYGTVQILDNRLHVSIQSIRYGDQIFSYNKKVYDRDGMPGIHIDSNEKIRENQEIAEEVASRTGVTSGVVGQVVQGVQSIFKRRGTNTVVIKSNYKLILK